MPKLKIVALLAIPMILAFVAESVFYLKFASDYPGADLDTQGKLRVIPSGYRQYKNNPGFQRRIHEVEYRYNNLGFRSESDLDPDEPKPLDEFRVFLLGGSAAYGTRSNEFGQYFLISGGKAYPNRQTISGHLEELLSEVVTDRKVKVYNAAVVNYKVNHNYMHYISVIRTLEPNLIITIDGYNENFKHSNPFATLSPLSGSHKPAEWLRRNSYTAYYAALFSQTSSLFDNIRGTNQIRVTEVQMADVDVTEIRKLRRSEVEEYEPSQDMMRALSLIYRQFAFAADFDDVPILFVVQPVLSLDQSHKFTEVEEKLYKYEWLAGAHPSRAGVPYLADLLAAESMRDPGFRYTSLLDVFEDFEGAAYTDYCHLSPGGNRHVAKKLVARLQQGDFSFAPH